MALKIEVCIFLWLLFRRKFIIFATCAPMSGVKQSWRSRALYLNHRCVKESWEPSLGYPAARLLRRSRLAPKAAGFCSPKSEGEWRSALICQGSPLPSSLMNSVRDSFNQRAEGEGAGCRPVDGFPTLLGWKRFHWRPHHCQHCCNGFAQHSFLSWERATF